MAVVLSLLRDGGELSLMNGDNNLDWIKLPPFWLLFFRNVNTYRVTSWSDDNNHHHSSKVGTTTTPQVTACDSATRSRRHATKTGKRKEIVHDGESLDQAAPDWTCSRSDHGKLQLGRN